MQEINSKQNKVYKLVKSLHMRKYREKHGLYILEGMKQVTHGLQMGLLPQFIFLMRSKSQEILNEWNKMSERKELSDCKDLITNKEFLHKQDGERKSTAGRTLESLNARLYILSDDLFFELSDTQHSQGVIGIFEIPKSPRLEHSKNCLVLDSLQDPGNVGSIIRNADAFGIRDIFLVKGSVDVYSAKVLRAAMGSFFNVNIYENLEMEEVYDLIKQRGNHLLLTDLQAQQYLSEYSFEHKDAGYALVLGNEGNGISPKWYEFEHEKIKIEMFGSAQSLNVAMASAILMYEMYIKCTKCI